MLYSLRSEALAVAILLPLIGLSNTANASEDGQSSAQSETLTACREAWRAWGSQLHSGSGEGTLEDFFDGKMKTNAKVKICFDVNRYRIEMDLLKSPLEKDTKQIAIYNNDKILFHVRFFPISPKTDVKEGYCYDTEDAFKPPLNGGFPFSPCHPISSIVSTAMESPQLKLHSVRENGLVLLRYEKPSLHLEIETSKKHGYNVSRVRSYRDGFDGQIASREDISWDKQNGIWFIKSIERELFFFTNGKPSGNRLSRFTYSTFKVNPELARNVFTIDSAGLPEGARIIDNRPQATIHEYRYTKNRQKRESNEGIISDVQQLPIRQTSQSGGPKPVSHRQRPFDLWKIGLSITGLFFLLLAVVIYRKSRIRTRNGSSQTQSRAE